MTTSNSQELDELRKRIEWLDQERRKSNKRIVELDQKLELQAREVGTRDQRIKDLEQELSATRTRLSGSDNVDGRMQDVRKEFVALMAKADERRAEAEREAERLRRNENNILAREIAEIRKELPTIPRLENSIEQRMAEESRLSQMIAGVQNRFSPIDTQLDSISNQTNYAAESVKQLTRQMTELQTEVYEVSKKGDNTKERVDSSSLALGRYDASITEIRRTIAEIESTVKKTVEQMRLAEYDRGQRVNGWQGAFEAYKHDMAKFQQEWAIVGDQHKQARSNLNTLNEWRKQIEVQQRELSEVTRIDSQRLQNRWDELVGLNEKQWKTFEVESDQRWATIERRQKQMEEQLMLIDERVVALKQEKDTLMRMQQAQTDAIRAFPSLWIDEVEKAIANDPERRRQPTPTPTPEDDIFGPPRDQ